MVTAARGADVAAPCPPWRGAPAACGGSGAGCNAGAGEPPRSAAVADRASAVRHGERSVDPPVPWTAFTELSQPLVGGAEADSGVISKAVERPPVRGGDESDDPDRAGSGGPWDGCEWALRFENWTVTPHPGGLTPPCQPRNLAGLHS